MVSSAVEVDGGENVVATCYIGLAALSCTVRNLLTAYSCE